MLNPERTFIFCSEKNIRMFAFTRDRTGLNLPRRYGPWHPSSASAMTGAPRENRTEGGGSGKAGEMASGAALSAIETKGFYLSRPDGNAW
jgi:hypothetical protein